jgi:hypothetical protein
VTPSGIEAGPNVAGSRAVTVTSTDDGATRRHPAASECNDCNEAAGALRQTLAVVRRLVLIADNAILEGDLRRARDALEELHAAADPLVREIDTQCLARDRHGWGREG